MTQNADLDPLTVLRWQEANCDIALTFDLPIFLNDTLQTKEYKLKQTAKNAIFALSKRQNKKLKLYAVFQGHTAKEQTSMLNYYGDSIKDFDGIAIGSLVPIAGNTEKLVKILTLFCYNMKDYKKPVHFFGLSGNKIIPYIIYLSKKFNLHITFDSSSYGAGAIRREFWLGNGSKKINCMKEYYDKMPCDCPVCSVVKDWKVYQQDGSLAGGLISLHNLYQTLMFVKESQTMN